MTKLSIQSLNKTYPNGVKALDDVNLELENGMFGLLGPNGAGKSSLMRTVATLQEADSGSVQLNGIDVFRDPVALRRTLGYLPQEFGVYPKITAEQLLDHIAILKGVTNKSQRKELVSYLLQKVNLYQHRNKSVKGFSGGMRQRVGIAQALVGSPELIIVDEPTAGLDPRERNRFHNLLADVGSDVIVILSTHIVDDVSELCNNMAIMNNGSIVYKGSPTDAMNMLRDQVWKKVITRTELDDYKQNFTVISDKMVAGNPVIHVLAPTKPDTGFESVEPNLEDVFFTNTSVENAKEESHV